MSPDRQSLSNSTQLINDEKSIGVKCRTWQNGTDIVLAGSARDLSKQKQPCQLT